MDKLYTDYLFQKHVIVSTGVPAEYPLETLFSLASELNIRITSGAELVFDGCLDYAAEQLGRNISDPFYLGFPETPRQLTPWALLMDQLLHYSITYGGGDFSEAGHSIFEEFAGRSIFQEELPPLDFIIVSKKEGIRVLGELVNGLLASSRPLSREQYHLVYRFYNDYHPKINAVASKNTCVKLLIDTRDLTFADFLALPDVIRLVEELSYAKYRKSRINHLNLRNKDRKFVTLVIDHLLAADSCSVRPCYEKKKHWAGLLHHIHYVPKTDRGRELVNAMRGRGNRSVYAAFEREMAAGHIAEAVRILHDGKGSAAVLRHLNYIVSRCEASEDMEAVLSCVDTGNVIVLIQLLMRYGTPQLRLRRVFQFAKFNMLRIHRETDREMGHRRSHISVGQAGMLEKRIR
ncbi:MAG: hypothetical protein K6B72_06480, partial [Lachnospiraceae bacterium]|nr:hypothetical protein [Lachnospiraceae bacterium]